MSNTLNDLVEELDKIAECVTTMLEEQEEKEEEKEYVTNIGIEDIQNLSTEELEEHLNIITIMRNTMESELIKRYMVED